MQSVGIALLAFGLAYAVLSPRHPAWALIPLPPQQQTLLLRRVALFAVSVVLVSMLVAPSRVPDFGTAGRNLVLAAVAVFLTRSEERRVGTEGVSPCRSRGSPYPRKKK